MRGKPTSRDGRDGVGGIHKNCHHHHRHHDETVRQWSPHLRLTPAHIYHLYSSTDSHLLITLDLRFKLLNSSVAHLLLFGHQARKTSSTYHESSLNLKMTL